MTPNWRLRYLCNSSVISVNTNLRVYFLRLFSNALLRYPDPFIWNVYQWFTGKCKLSSDYLFLRLDPNEYFDTENKSV